MNISRGKRCFSLTRRYFNLICFIRCLSRCLAFTSTLLFTYVLFCRVSAISMFLSKQHTYTLRKICYFLLFDFHLVFYNFICISLIASSMHCLMQNMQRMQPTAKYSVKKCIKYALSTKAFNIF